MMLKVSKTLLTGLDACLCRALEDITGFCHKVPQETLTQSSTSGL